MASYQVQREKWQPWRIRKEEWHNKLSFYFSKHNRESRNRNSLRDASYRNEKSVLIIKNGRFKFVERAYQGLCQIEASE